MENTSSSESPPQAGKSRRIKKFHHKAKTGCINCKARRVKCDEQRPHCATCLRRDMTCQGYVAPKPWLFVPSRQSSKPLTHPSLHIMPATSFYESAQQAWSLQYFCEVTAPATAMWQLTRSAQDFWLVHVRQHLRSNKSIRHLAAALSARTEHSEIFQSRHQMQFTEDSFAKGLAELVDVNTAKHSSPESVVMAGHLISSYLYLDPIEKAVETLQHVHATQKILASPSLRHFSRC
jgi:hypothetical protein